MMKVVLHIGPQKTGSSALQTALAENRDLLSKHGICYPKCRQELLGCIDLSSLDQAPRLIKSKYKKDPSQAVRDLDQAWQAVSREAAARPRILIMSSEYFFESLNEATAAHLKFRLSNLHGELQVVAYARKPSDLYLSRAQQSIKQSSRFPEDLLQVIQNRTSLEQWERHFPGQVSVFPYDRKKMLQGDIVTDFFSRIGADVESSQLITAGKNESLSAEAMAILQNFHRTWYPRSDDQPRRGKEVFRRVVSHLDTVDTSRRRPQLRPNVAKAINDACADDSRWLAARWNIHFPFDTETTTEPPHFTTVAELCEVDKRRQRRLTFSAYRRWLPAYMRRVSGDAWKRLKRRLSR